MKPSELDKQCPIQIERWIEIDSEEWRDMDNMPDFTKKILRYGFEDNWLYTDDLGRIWGKPKDGGPHWPLHFDYGTKKYGYRISKKAVN